MDINCLLKDELEFELACRGILNLNNVQSMRKILRELVSSEEQGRPSLKSTTPSCLSDVAGQLVLCEDKFSVLSINLSEIAADPDRDSIRRIRSRLVHLKHRLELVKPSSEEDILTHTTLSKQIEESLNSFTSFKGQIKDQEEILSENDKDILHQSLGEEAVRLIEKLEGANSQVSTPTRAHIVQSDAPNHQDQQSPITDFNKADLVRSSVVNQDIYSRKLVPIKDWGIKFYGKGGLSVNAFLERVEEIKSARNANDGDLWRYSIDFFEGDALIWFRANKEYVSDWKGLVHLLLESFQSPLYQDELMEEIKKRTQGKYENVTIYIAIMQNMFRRLPNKLSESQKLAILLKNIQPYYQKAVCRDVFHSVLGLSLVLRVLERTKHSCDNFKEPTATVDALEPDLAYQNTSSNELAAMGNDVAPKSETEMKCWNCRAIGHTFRNCSIPKQRLFCYRCGRFGQTSSNCSCNNQGNGRMEDFAPARYPPRH